MELKEKLNSKGFLQKISFSSLYCFFGACGKEEYPVRECVVLKGFPLYCIQEAKRTGRGKA